MSFSLTAPHTAKDGKPFTHKRRIGSCMTYRSDIVWIDIAETPQNILKLIKAHADFNYFPVCAQKIDTVIGILNVRDYLQSRLETPPPNLQALVTKPLFIPETQTIEHTLELLKQHSTNTACIIDEYGGIEGFVTKNGLLTILLNESIQAIGRNGKQPFKQTDGGFIVSAQMSLDEVQALQLLEDIERSPNEDYYTLAGYLLARLDAIPHPGDSIDIGSYICTVRTMDGRRINQVIIKKKSV